MDSFTFFVKFLSQNFDCGSKQIRNVGLSIKPNKPEQTTLSRFLDISSNKNTNPHLFDFH